MPTGGEPQPDDETVVLPDWAMLCRVGRTLCHNGLDDARVAANKNETAAGPLDMDGGPSCYVSFTLAAPRKGLSYLNLHWPKEQVSDDLYAYSYVRATDQDLALFDVSVPPSQVYCILDAPPVLFVYSAGPSPSVQRLPRCTTKYPNPFLINERTTGILRLTKDHYIVADLNVHPEGADSCIELCIFNSDLKDQWEIITDMSVQQPRDQSNGGGQFPILWSSHHVLAFAGRFLCWIDYFSGVLLCDFSDSPELLFVPFPGEEEYHDAVRVENYFPERFRSVSISQGKMCFVHIDNDFHDRTYSPCHNRQLPEKNRGPPEKITVWTLNSTLEWELHHVISLHRLWPQPAYQALDIHQRLPEFPIIAADDPYVLCCMLTEKEFRGKGWMIVVDNHACLRSCTPESESVDTKAPHDDFPTIPIVPTVFCKYLEKPTGVTSNNDKVATRLSKKHKHARFLSKNRKVLKVKTWNPVTGALWRRLYRR